MDLALHTWSGGIDQACQPPKFPQPHRVDSGKLWTGNRGEGLQELLGHSVGPERPPQHKVTGRSAANHGDIEGTAHKELCHLRTFLPNPPLGSAVPKHPFQEAGEPLLCGSVPCPLLAAGPLSAP